MSGDSGETNLIVPETEAVSENNVTQPEKKEKSIPLPVPQQNKREKTSNMKSTSKKASTPKKSSSKKPSTSEKASSSSEHRDMSFKEKHHDSHIHVIGSLNERMNNSSNRYNKNSKYSDSHYQNRYATHTSDKYYSHNYRTGKQYYNNRSNWNSYSNSPQSYNFNYRPRNYYYSHDKYNSSRENEFPLKNDNTYYNHYNNNYGESSGSVNCEETLEHVNMDDNEKHETSYRNPFLSNLPSSENPFRKLYSENDVSSPKSSKDRLTAEASVSDSDERAVSSTNKLTNLSKSNTSAPRKCFSISKIGSKRTITRSRSLSASESDRKRKDKTDQAESEESEEQRIQDWTNSLLENNHNQITRLVNPSNNKEKAAVNHLITQFSKSKRKEILTRTLRTNSSELTDNDDRDLICEGEPVNTEDEEISVVLDSKIINSNLEQSDINLSSLSASKTINSENSENNRINQNKECETVLEPSKSPYQSSKMYKKYEKLKDNNFASNRSSYNNNSNISYREKYVKRKSGGSDAKVKKKQKTDSIRNTTCVNRNESEDLNRDNPRQTMTPENTFCSPINTMTPNQDLSASDIKEEVIETTGENVADSSSTTNNEKTLEENLVFSSDVSVDTLIQLFASGSVKVKEEFNDPVMDVLKEINPDELINACSNNSIHSCEETVNKNNTSSANCINSKETSFSEACMRTVHKNKSGMNPVILGSAAIEHNTSPDSVPAKSCALNESPCSSVATEPTPSTSERSELHNHSFSCTDNDKNSDNSSLNFNEINNTKVGLPPYLNKLIKQLQDITSEEEKVKENLIEAKSKINMYASLLEEWKTKKKVLNEEEESLRKQRNNIIKLMQNAVKTDSDHDEQESKSSSLEDDRLGDLSTNKKKQMEENSAEIVNASRTSHTSLSSVAEKQQKQVKTGLSPGSPESDEIVIISPPQKPKPPEIIICDDEENISLDNQAKVLRQEVNSNMPSNKSSSIYDLRTVDAHTTVINSLVKMCYFERKFIVVFKNKEEKCAFLDICIKRKIFVSDCQGNIFAVFEDFLYTCSNDNTAKRYSLKSATPCVTYQHTAKNVTEIVVEKVQNEALVFTSCSARLISLFIAASGTKIKNFFPPCPVMSICKGWGKFYAGLANGSVNVYNWKYEEIELVKTEHPASRIATAHQGRLHVLVILSSEGNIAIRDAETGLLIRYIKINIKHPSWMCVHNDLAYLSSADKILIVLDIMSGKIGKKLHMNSHTTGLAVYDDFIFTISYNGIINCYNKDNSNDKRLFYGTGKAGLTCIHVYNNWVFTGNRKGDVSLFHFDPSSVVACEFGKCDIIYGLKEDLEYHIEKDHLQKKKMLTQCNWRGCNFKFPRCADIVDKMNHVKTHIYQMDFAPTFLVSC